MPAHTPYRGRIAPSPTGYLHAGHVATFQIAAQRAREAGGVLLYREEDIDQARCKDEYRQAAMEDLRAAGIAWQEGPDCGGDFAPYRQSERQALYIQHLQQLADQGLIYPSDESRQEVAQHAKEQSAFSGEVLFPQSLRKPCPEKINVTEHLATNWRFCVSENQTVTFIDQRLGECHFQTGKDFSDFLVWRKEGAPSYELAVVVDDALMKITEVVRGEDLLLSTARQLLLYQVFGYEPPAFYHTPLVLDENGQKLSKRNRLAHGRELFSGKTK